MSNWRATRNGTPTRFPNHPAALAVALGDAPSQRISRVAKRTGRAGVPNKVSGVMRRMQQLRRVAWPLLTRVVRGWVRALGGKYRKPKKGIGAAHCAIYGEHLNALTQQLHVHREVAHLS